MIIQTRYRLFDETCNVRAAFATMLDIQPSKRFQVPPIKSRKDDSDPALCAAWAAVIMKNAERTWPT